MNWDYRVMKHTYKKDDVQFTIHEVYYDKKGNIKMWTEPVEPSGVSFEELTDDFAHYQKAFAQPVLEVIKDKEIYEIGPMGNSPRKLVWQKKQKERL